MSHFEPSHTKIHLFDLAVGGLLAAGLGVACGPSSATPTYSVDSGGTSPGGAASSTTGGVTSGSTATGGAATGGSDSGGSGTGGNTTGAGGNAAGGVGTGGDGAGGDGTGGDGVGGNGVGGNGTAGTGGAATGGTAAGGEGTGGSGTAGQGTAGTGGSGTGAAAGTGGTSTGGAAPTEGDGGGGGDPPDGQDGIILVLPGEVDTSCVPICVSTTTQVATSEPVDWDPESDDPEPVPLGEENGAYCALETEGKRTCTTGQYPPSFVPPALTGNKQQPGFYTSGGRLLDAYGNDFVMRGISNAHVWYDMYGQYLAYEALDNIASYGTNLLRVVWEAKGPASLLAEVLYRVVELEMVPMVELHEATGETSTDALLAVAQYWTQPDVVRVAQDFREYLLINIANEWNGTNNYLDAYRQAISTIRGAGLEHTLVIDANGYGQIIPSSGGDRQTLINAWFDNAHTLYNEDNNLLFSVHMYGWYKTADEVADILGRSDIGSTLPFIIGEFAYEHSGTQVAWQAIMQQCQDRNIGWISWSWYGNSDDVAFLDMATGWEGSLNDWGQNIFTRTNGIQQTAQKASIFN